MFWTFSLQNPGSRAGVPGCKGLSPRKPVSSLDQGFGWAVITMKSLYFWCCLVPLKPLRVCPGSLQKPRPGKLPVSPCRQEVHGEGVSRRCVWSWFLLLCLKERLDPAMAIQHLLPSTIPASHPLPCECLAATVLFALGTAERRQIDKRGVNS